jgi:sec-independent protein translocase protein TatA
MEALSIPHLLIILVIVLVFFGGRRIPDVMKGLGQGIREFKDGMRGGPDTSVHPNPSVPSVTPPVVAQSPTEEKK